YTKALERAQEFGIDGVTYSMTQGVVKNIIPAIASTNAVVAASLVNEAVKLATNVNPFLNNYMMYTGDEGVYTYTFEHEKKEGCPVCGDASRPVAVRCKRHWTLNEFMETLAADPNVQAKK